MKYIFVKNDSEIPIIYDFIKKDLDHHPLNDLKILTTRIVSTETIQKDI